MFTDAFIGTSSIDESVHSKTTLVNDDDTEGRNNKNANLNIMESSENVLRRYILFFVSLCDISVSGLSLPKWRYTKTK